MDDIRIHEYKIGELNVKVTSNIPSPEAIKAVNIEINKLYVENIAINVEVTQFFS